MGEAVQRPVRAAEQVAPPLLVERVGPSSGRPGRQRARAYAPPSCVATSAPPCVRSGSAAAMPRAGEVQRRAAARLELGATVGRHPHENVVVDEPGRCGGTAGQRLDRVG